MFSEWFKKRVTIEDEFQIKPEKMHDQKLILDFLDRQRYREITVKDSTVKAVRGRKIWNLCNIGDPRRNYNSIELSICSRLISVRIDIDSWFGFGTKSDTGIFLSEIEMLRNYIETREFSLKPLMKAKLSQRKSDLKTIIIFLGLAVFLGIVTGILF